MILVGSKYWIDVNGCFIFGFFYLYWLVIIGLFMKVDLYIYLVVIFKELFIFYMFLSYVYVLNGILLDILVL